MRSGRGLRLFVVAFVVTIVVVVVAALLRSPGDGSDAAASSTTPAVAPSTTVTATAVDSTDSSTTSIVVATKELPTLDFAQVCSDLEGDGSQFVDNGDRFQLVCRTADGQDLPIDVRNACEATFGEGSRAVLIEVNQGADAWRCSSRERVELGSPDWDAECRRRFGDTAVAFLIADDSLGWRCASTVNGIFADDEIAWDAACQTTYGPQSFGEVMGPLPDDNICYGAA